MKTAMQIQRLTEQFGVHRSLVTRVLQNIALFFALGLIVFVILFGMLGLRFNSSASMPIGIYRTTADPTALTVAFCPGPEASSMSITRDYRPAGSCPDGAAPLLKTIIAKQGDEVDAGPAGLIVNHHLLPHTKPLSRDSAGRPLTAWPFGHYIVPAGRVWVASTLNDRSYDSRYYGPIQTSQILYYLKSVLTFSAH
jgi:conjugative transfer signal peptidase TraF